MKLVHYVTLAILAAAVIFVVVDTILENHR